MRHNRNQRRHPSEHDKSLYKNQLSDLTDSQLKLVDKLAVEKANHYILNTAKIINNCYFIAMRNNKIGKQRAERIIKETEILIDMEGKSNE